MASIYSRGQTISKSERKAYLGYLTPEGEFAELPNFIVNREGELIMIPYTEWKEAFARRWSWKGRFLRTCGDSVGRVLRGRKSFLYRFLSSSYTRYIWPSQTASDKTPHNTD